MIPISNIQIEAGSSLPLVVKKSTTLSSSILINTLISLGFVIDTLSIATEGQLSQSGFDPLGFASGGFISRELFGPEPYVTPTLKSTILGIMEVDATGDQLLPPIEQKSVRIYTSSDIELSIQSIPASRKKTRVSAVSVEV